MRGVFITMIAKLPLPQRLPLFTVGMFMAFSVGMVDRVKAEVSGTADALDHVRPDVIVNAPGESYDSLLSASMLPDGTTWVAWQAYHASQERVLARRVGPREEGPIMVVSEQPGIHDVPHVVAMDADSIWVVWSSRQEGRWKVLARRLEGDAWQSTVILSDPQTDAFKPTATLVGEGKLLVTWFAGQDKRLRVWTRLLDGAKWADATCVSSGDYDAFRPVLATAHDGTAWAFWDRYEEGNYAIVGRQVYPDLGVLERVSPQGDNCLTPTAVGSKQGLCVAWVKLTDVIGGEGAVDQLHTLHMAVRGKQGWRMATNEQGNADAAVLIQGLLARMVPEPGGVWGYLGERRHPMLLEDGDSVVLLWERKLVYEGPTPLLHGPTPETNGELIGRRYNGQHWEEPVVLHRGMVQYHLVSEPRAYRSKFGLMCSELPRYHRRFYHRVIADLSVHVPCEEDVLAGWKPVQLPLEQEVPRHQITVDGQSYTLYWADSHCHSNLSADAEGEVDELLHYARDRARLDFVVVQENDEIYNVYLTESEYALGQYFANWIRRDHKFLALPGFEWTARVSLDGQTDPEQYMGRCYVPETDQSHRTVIYPPSGGPIVRWTEVGNDINKLYEAVASAGGILHTQHWHFVPGHHPCETSIEVTAGWDIYILDPTHIHKTLNEGYRLGFVGTSDNHRRCPGLGGGLTGIYAESLTPAAILDAYRKHRVYATNGSHIIIDAKANGRPMGEEIETDGGVTLSLLVKGSKPIVRVTLVGDGEDLKVFEGDGDSELEATFTADSLSTGTHWYYWRVEQEGVSPRYPSNMKVARGHLAWSTPHWVKVP